MRIIEHTDLTKNFSSYNAWKSEESFPISRINITDLKNLEKFKVVEYIYDGMLSNRSQVNFERLVTDFSIEMSHIVLNSKRNQYLFSIEHSSNIISKIRTYKGLISRNEITTEHIIQKEMFIDDKESRFAFVAEINSDNLQHLLKYFFDYSTSFIIATDNHYLTEDFLAEVCSLFDLKGWSHINFLNIMLRFCSKGDTLFRIGGNDGEEYWSLQAFTTK